VGLDQERTNRWTSWLSRFGQVREYQVGSVDVRHRRHLLVALVLVVLVGTQWLTRITYMQQLLYPDS